MLSADPTSLQSSCSCSRFLPFGGDSAGIELWPLPFVSFAKPVFSLEPWTRLEAPASFAALKKMESAVSSLIPVICVQLFHKRLWHSPSSLSLNLERSAERERQIEECVCGGRFYLDWSLISKLQVCSFLAVKSSVPTVRRSIMIHLPWSQQMLEPICSDGRPGRHGNEHAGE